MKEILRVLEASDLWVTVSSELLRSWLDYRNLQSLLVFWSNIRIYVTSEAYLQYSSISSTYLGKFNTFYRSNLIS